MPAVLSHKEEVEWVTRPVGDQLEGLDRRLCLAGLHEVDGGPADVLAGDLAQAEPSLLAGLLDRARPDLDAPTPPATAARGGLPLPSRAVRLGCARHLSHGASLTQAPLT